MLDGEHRLSGAGGQNREARSELAKLSVSPQGVSALCVRRGTHTENRSLRQNALVMTVKPVRGWSANRTLCRDCRRKIAVSPPIRSVAFLHFRDIGLASITLR